MIEHQVITPFTTEWIIYNSITLTLILIVILFGRRLYDDGKHYLTLGLSILFVIEFGEWKSSISIKVLVHRGFSSLICVLLCGLSPSICSFPNRWAFELMLFIGMPGGIHSTHTRTHTWHYFTR